MGKKSSPFSKRKEVNNKYGYKGGGTWAVIEGIELVFVAVGASLVVLFFVIGFCSESIDVKDEMRFESILRMLIRLGLAEWFVANNVTIMKAFFTSMH